MKAAPRTARNVVEILGAGEATASNIQLGYKFLDWITTELYSWRNRAIFYKKEFEGGCSGRIDALRPALQSSFHRQEKVY